MNLNSLKYFTVLMFTITSLNASHFYGQKTKMFQEYKAYNLSKFNPQDTLTTKPNNESISLLSGGTGFGFYNFLNLYLFELNYILPIGQDSYMKTGLLYTNVIDYDSVESVCNCVYVNLHFLHLWKLKRISFLWAGIGLSISPLGSILGLINVKYDLTISDRILLGPDFKYIINLNKKASKYIKYPFLSINISYNF